MLAQGDSEQVELDGLTRDIYASHRNSAPGHLIHLNTYLMQEVINQFDDANARKRVLGGSKNSFTFILGHIIWCRSRMASILGEPLDFPWMARFAGGQSQTDGSDYPDLAALAAAYEKLAAVLKRKLKSVSEEEFMVATEGVPGEQENTARGTIAFWVWQDCYHMGQVGSVVTTLGLTDLKTLHHDRQQRLRKGP